jgi:hypothetical protein
MLRWTSIHYKNHYHYFPCEVLTLASGQRTEGDTQNETKKWRGFSKLMMAVPLD